MVANVSFNPFVTTVGNTGLFNTFTDGVRQGTAYPDPSTMWRLRQGILATSETLPMWGGVGIYADVPGSSANPNKNLGAIVGRATTLTAFGAGTLAGFSVFDEAYAMVTSPQSPVPLAASGNQVNWYPLGSLARIAVACDPTLVSLFGGPIKPQVSWDFVNQLLVPFNSAALTISSGTYNNTTGLVTLTMSATINFGPGDAIVVSALTGTGAFASLDGTWTAIAPTTGTTVTYQAAAGLGATTITGGSLSLGSGANSVLPVAVLEVMSSNCETVSYNSTTGFATWNFNGAAAIIQI